MGSANARNPIAIVVPCHRVIGADGKLTGYGGGLERKHALLAHEGAHPGVSRGAPSVSSSAARGRTAWQTRRVGWPHGDRPHVVLILVVLVVVGALMQRRRRAGGVVATRGRRRRR